MAAKFVLSRQLSLALLALLLVISLAWTIWAPPGDVFNFSGGTQFLDFWQAGLHPDLHLSLLATAWQGMLTTFAYAVWGTILSLCLGFIGSILISEVGRQVFGSAPWLSRGLRAILVVPRAIHEMLWGLLLINLWGLDPLTAIAAIIIPYSAIVAKVFADILDDTPRQPLQALIQSGVHPGSALLYGLLPLASKNLLSYSFYRFECSLRSAATLGIIGVGGLGHEIFLSLQSLRYEQVWTFIYVLVLLNGSIDWSSAWCRQRLGCQNRITLHLQPIPNKLQVHSPPIPAIPLKQGAAAARLLPFGWVMAGIIGMSMWSWDYISPDLTKLVAPRTWHQGQQLMAGLWPISPSSLTLTDLLGLSLQTLTMAFMAMIGAGMGGIVFSFATAANFFLPGGLFLPKNAGFGQRNIARLLVGMARLILLLCRAIPAPIWALIVLFVVFPGVLPGAIALGIHNLGILGRLMAEVNENLDQQPLVALQAQGAPSTSVFLYGVLPMTLPRFLAYSCYRWEVGMRETVIVGLVGAGGLGRLLSEQLSSFDSAGVMWTLSCFVLLSLCVDWCSHQLRYRLQRL